MVRRHGVSEGALFHLSESFTRSFQIPLSFVLPLDVSLVRHTLHSLFNGMSKYWQPCKICIWIVSSPNNCRLINTPHLDLDRLDKSDHTIFLYVTPRSRYAVLMVFTTLRPSPSLRCPLFPVGNDNRQLLPSETQNIDEYRPPEITPWSYAIVPI